MNTISLLVRGKRRLQMSPMELLAIAELVALVFLGLAVALLYVLGHRNAGVHQFFDIGHVVILRNVDSGDCAQHEYETSSYYAHFRNLRLTNVWTQVGS